MEEGERRVEGGRERGEGERRDIFESGRMGNYRYY